MNTISFVYLVFRFANTVTYFDYIPHPNCSLDSAEPFGPELKAEGLKAEGLVAGSTKS
jgi:hypothetical protein